MPIPFLIPLAGAASLFGAGKLVKARIDQKDANSTNARARSIANRAKEEAEKSRERSGQAIKDLGQRKIDVLNKTVMPFIESFEKLHNIELTEVVGYKEAEKIVNGDIFLKGLKEMGSMASSIAEGVAGGAVIGVLTAYGAYGAAATFGTCATTGTLIATLNGAAASNATLAFLGGGATAVMGGGMVAGTAVLGGLVTAPLLVIMGCVTGAKASANNDKAYANLSKAEEFKEEMHNLRLICNGIRLRANMYERLLIKLDAIFTPLQYELNEIIRDNGVDYFLYTDEQKNTVAAGLSTVAAIKAVLDTPILTEDGELTSESETIPDVVNNVLKSASSKQQAASSKQQAASSKQQHKQHS